MITTKKIRKKGNANMVECLHGLLNMLKITLNKKKRWQWWLQCLYLESKAKMEGDGQMWIGIAPCGTNMTIDFMIIG
jgi:hypothetical protein